jgi:hypothetical protein
MMRLEGEVPVAGAKGVNCPPFRTAPFTAEYLGAWRNMTAPAPQAINNPLGYHANFDGDA